MLLYNYDFRGHPHRSPDYFSLDQGYIFLYTNSTIPIKAHEREGKEAIMVVKGKAERGQSPSPPLGMRTLLKPKCPRKTFTM